MLRVHGLLFRLNTIRIILWRFFLKAMAVFLGLRMTYIGFLLSFFNLYL